MSAAVYNEADLERKLSKEFQSLNTLVSSTYKKHGKTPACSKAIQQLTEVFYRKVALNYNFRKVRGHLLSSVNKSGKKYFYKFYDEGGCKAKLYAIPSASSVSSKAFSSTLNSLVVDHGSVQVLSRKSAVVGNSNEDRIHRLTQGQSHVGIGSSQTIHSLSATTQVAIFFCICYSI